MNESVFSANIVALIQSPSNTIQTFQNLLESPLLLGIDENIFDGQSIRKEYQTEYVNISDVDDGVRRMRVGYFAYLGISSLVYETIADTFKESEKCGLSDIHILPYPMTTIIVEKHSPIKELLKQR